MAWIEVHQELRLHPKIIRLANYLECQRAHAIGYVVSLWLWAIAYSRDGNITGFSDREIAEGCQWEGEAKKIVTGLVSSGFIDTKHDKKIIHDWKKHGLRILEESKKRVSKHRKEKELQKIDETLQKRNGNVLLSFFLSNHSNLSNLSVLSTPEFEVAWNDWFEYRKEKKKPIFQQTADKQLLWLLQQSNPIACIEQSIRNSWQGLFELKENANGKLTSNTVTPTKSKYADFGSSKRSIQPDANTETLSR